MAVGLCRLRLPPDVFWALSLPEWRAMTAPASGAPSLPRRAFHELMARYPD